MPRLRVLAGESPSSLKPISANSSSGHTLKTSAFDGEIAVFLKDFVNESGDLSSSDAYFGSEERKGCTWSIQARGRFLKDINADDLLFGNTFDRPLTLPYGSSAAIKFMQYADPTLEEDLYGEKPWALSPLISTMPYFSISDSPPSSSKTSVLISENSTSILPSPSSPQLPTHRRTHFRTAPARRALTFKPSHHIALDFCHGLLSFKDNGLAVSFPTPVTPVSFDLMRYWDGRPVWFVCCERAQGGKGPGNVIWCVGFEILDGLDEDAEGSEEEDGAGEEGGGEAKRVPAADNSGDID